MIRSSPCLATALAIVSFGIVPYGILSTCRFVVCFACNAGSSEASVIQSEPALATVGSGFGEA